MSGLAEGQRKRLLERADNAVAGADDSERVTAIAIYRALVDDLEPRDAVDCARIMHLIHEGPSGSLRELMTATRERGADPEVRQHAGLVLAQIELLGGDAAKAEERHLEALRAGRGRWPGLTAAAYTSYARLCLEQRRDIEALVLARRGSEACDAVGDVVGAIYGRLVEAHALQSLEDWPRVARAVEHLVSLRPSAPSGANHMLTYGVAGLESDLAVAQGRPDDALRAIQRSEKLARRRDDPSWSQLDTHLILAELDALHGRHTRALFEVERALLIDEDDEERILLLETWRVRLKAALGHDDLADVAEAWLTHLEDGVGARLGHGLALRVGQDGGAALERVGEHAGLVHRAYQAAAAGALSRLVEIERFVHEFPEFARPTDAEAQVVADHRARTAGSERSLRDAVAELLVREHAAGRRPLAPFSSDHGIVPCCAWCGRLRNRAGLWLPMPETLLSLPQNVVNLTHGICEPCGERVCKKASLPVPRVGARADARSSTSEHRVR